MELVRFCCKEDYVIRGIANKLFKHFCRNWSFPKVISYADKRWSNGNIYKNLGFTLKNESDPGYTYTRRDRRFHRMQFTKKKLVLEGFDEDLTESQIMQLKGYDRIWDCGQYVFEFSP